MCGNMVSLKVTDPYWIYVQHSNSLISINYLPKHVAKIKKVLNITYKHM